MNNDHNTPKARILFVDDDRENRDNFKALFRREYDILLAASAREGLEILEQQPIQVLITDQRMPDMNGTQLLALAAERYPKICRFLVTAYSDYHPLVDAINKGRLQGYFAKPIDVDFMRFRIQEGLQGYYLELENKDMFQTIQQNERFLNAIIENIPDMIFVKDARDLRYIRINRAGEELIGYNRQDVIGKSDRDLFDAEDADLSWRTDRKTLEDGRLLDIPALALGTATMGRRLLHAKKIPIMNERGQAAFILGVARDITELQHHQEREKKLESQLRHLQKMEAIGTLAGGIAHDFNNILSSIMGYTELALGEIDIGVPLEGYLREIYRAGERARDLSKQILDFARRSEAEIEPIRVDVIAKEVAKFLRSSIPTTINIVQDIRSTCYIMGNFTHLHQLVMNLCTNAAQAMDDKGGVLSISTMDLDASKHPLPTKASSPHQWIKITISDTGPGIPADIIDSIFEPYFTTKKPGEGTGMGLAMVKRIVDSYHGRIELSSEPGQGTQFRVYFPTTPKRITYPPPTTWDPPRGNESILFIDDELPIATIGHKALTRLGYQVTCHTDALEALELFRNTPHMFDVVVTDLTMPKLTGDALAQELLKIKPDVPIILCTGFSKKMSPEKTQALGIKAFLTKPVAIKDLARTIREILDSAI